MKKLLLLILPLMLIPKVVDARDYLVESTTKKYTEKKMETNTLHYIGETEENGITYYLYQKDKYITIKDTLDDKDTSLYQLLESVYPEAQVKIASDDDIYKVNGHHNVHYRILISMDKSYEIDHDLLVNIKENEIEEIIPKGEPMKQEDVTTKVVTTTKVKKKTTKKVVTTSESEPEIVEVTSDEIMPVEFLKNEIKEEESNDKSLILIGGIVVLVVSFCLIVKKLL